MSLVNSAKLVLDEVSGFANATVYHNNFDLDHFNIPYRKAKTAERLETFFRVRRYHKRRWSQRLPFAQPA
jgi:hypothetical protein